MPLAARWALRVISNSTGAVPLAAGLHLSPSLGHGVRADSDPDGRQERASNPLLTRPFSGEAMSYHATVKCLRRPHWPLSGRWVPQGALAACRSHAYTETPPGRCYL